MPPKMPMSRLRLWLQLKPKLLRMHKVSVYETLERPLVPVLMAMEEMKAWKWTAMCWPN